MQQRRLRLGDILDDYCPRERRITNHTVVAMIEDRVKQTRCTTCDADHEYKEAKVPTLRKKRESPTLADEVLAGMPRGVIRRRDEGEPAARTETSAGPSPAEPASAVASEASVTRSIADFGLHDREGEESAGEPAASARPATSGPPEEGPLHRPLIRATLPRIEGQVPVRKETDFTMRHAPNHPAGFQANGAARPGARRRPGRGPAGGGQGQNRFTSAGRPAGAGNRPPGRGNQRPGQPQARTARPAGGHTARPGKKRR